jgi:hypothetical protein
MRREELLALSAECTALAGHAARIAARLQALAREIPAGMPSGMDRLLQIAADLAGKTGETHLVIGTWRSPMGTMHPEPSVVSEAGASPEERAAAMWRERPGEQSEPALPAP